jgi:hypothetical protein
MQNYQARGHTKLLQDYAPPSECGVLQGFDGGGQGFVIRGVTVALCF